MLDKNIPDLPVGECSGNINGKKNYESENGNAAKD